MSLLDRFCDVDDFCKAFEPQWQRSQLATGQRRRKRQQRLSLSEIMTIVIHFHQSPGATFSFLLRCGAIGSAATQLWGR
jgi:hypothetical protein